MKAVDLLWNARTKECEELLSTRKDSNLHAGAYYAMVHSIQRFRADSVHLY